jgi:hypothetical protein
MTEDERDTRREQLEWLKANGFTAEAQAGLEALQDEIAEEWSDLVDKLPEIRDLNPPVVLCTTSSPDLVERLKVAHRWHVDCATGEVTHIS